MKNHKKARSVAAGVVATLALVSAVWALPAAHVGSGTDHSGSVANGSPDVFVEGSPAARIGDQVTCPLQCEMKSGAHVGGPIVTGSATVFINGLGAARVSDLANELCAQSTIVTGATSVDIGG